MQDTLLMMKSSSVLLGELHISVLIMLALLLMAAILDIRSYRIPNWLSFSGIVFAITTNTLMPISPDQGWGWSIQGMLIGFAMTIPLYATKTMGAGDVKLISMVGAFLGAPAAFYAVICIFITGGVTAMLFALSRGVLGQMLRNVKTYTWNMALTKAHGLPSETSMDSAISVGKLPYGVSISLGTLGYLIAHQLAYL